MKIYYIYKVKICDEERKIKIYKIETIKLFRKFIPIKSIIKSFFNKKYLKEQDLDKMLHITCYSKCEKTALNIVLKEIKKYAKTIREFGYTFRGYEFDKTKFKLLLRELYDVEKCY